MAQKSLTCMMALSPMVRTDSPSTLFLFFQNPISFLKAKKSKTECISETAQVRARKYGLPSSRTLLNSSDSPSPIAPQDCCSKIEFSNLCKMQTCLGIQVFVMSLFLGF